MENPLSSIAINFQIESWMLWVALLLFLVPYTIISAILFYHWRKYGMKNSRIIFAEFVFTIVSIFLIYLAGVGIAVF